MRELQSAPYSHNGHGQMPELTRQQTSLGSIQSMYQNLNAQFGYLLLGEQEAKDAMAVTLINGGNIALIGEGAGGKSTFGENVQRAVYGLNEIVVVPERSDLKVAQLLGTESEYTKTTTDAQGKKHEEKTRFKNTRILHPGAQGIWGDEFNHLPPQIVNSLSEAFEARRYKDDFGASVALNGLEYVAVGLNPGRARFGQFAIKPAVATRFGGGVMLGQFKNEAELDARLLNVGELGWRPNPGAMSEVVDLEEVHAARNFISGGNIAFPESLRKHYLTKIKAADSALREEGFGEIPHRIAKQTTANASALAAFNGEGSLSPEHIDAGLRLVICSRIGMLSVNAVEDFPRIMDQISSAQPKR